MITYQVESGFSGPTELTDALWRLEFRAPVSGYDDVLVWIDNTPRDVALRIEASWRAGADEQHNWCKRCPPGRRVPEEHQEHDALPEEQGWHLSEMTHVRIMPMREAV